MDIKLAGDLRMESEIPLLKVEEFSFLWKPNHHAWLKVTGLINRSIPCRWEKIYGSKVKLWQEGEKGQEILFYGYLKKASEDTVADTERICLKIESGSCKLDIKEGSQSFQDTGKTYSEIEKEVVEESGGLVICSEGENAKIEHPVIRYKETVWIFSKRMASHVGSCLVPDVESGKPAFWFGMPKGKRIFGFPEDEYMIQLENDGKIGSTLFYQVDSREFYRIGDQSTFLGQEVMVTEVSGNYKHGELTFTYVLKCGGNNYPMRYQSKFAGLGLKGTVLDVQKESVKVALDIDGGKSTGGYYYSWFPETGNALYAMPETGAEVVLSFRDVDERDGFVIHCLPNVLKDREYTKRCLELENGGIINLTEDSLSFLRTAGPYLSLSDGMVSFHTSKYISISADDKIKFKAKKILIEADDEVKFYQG